MRELYGKISRVLNETTEGMQYYFSNSYTYFDFSDIRLPANPTSIGLFSVTFSPNTTPTLLDATSYVKRKITLDITQQAPDNYIYTVGDFQIGYKTSEETGVSFYRDKLQYKTYPWIFSIVTPPDTKEGLSMINSSCIQAIDYSYGIYIGNIYTVKGKYPILTNDPTIPGFIKNGDELLLEKAETIAITATPELNNNVLDVCLNNNITVSGTYPTVDLTSYYGKQLFYT